MRWLSFSDARLLAILRETDRDGVAVAAECHGVGAQAIYGWREKFGAFQVNDVRRLKKLESENDQLKRLVAERDLEIEVMK